MTKKNRSGSSNRWLKEHFDDKYVQKAHKMGLRSRAVFKIEEIQQKDKLIKPGMCVVDLGAAPNPSPVVEEKSGLDPDSITVKEIKPEETNSQPKCVGCTLVKEMHGGTSYCEDCHKLLPGPHLNSVFRKNKRVAEQFLVRLAATAKKHPKGFRLKDCRFPRPRGLMEQIWAHSAGDRPILIEATGTGKRRRVCRPVFNVWYHVYVDRSVNSVW